MIRGNLATQPFYNEGVIHRWLGIALLLIGAFTVQNAWQVVRYATGDRELQARTASDESRAAELRGAAAALSRTASQETSSQMRDDVATANQLIGQRTFSWTELFNHLEASLPRTVRITSIRPAVQAGPVRPLGITVVAQDEAAIDEFIQNLEDTGAFAEALARDEQVNESGEIEGAITVSYRQGVMSEVAAR
jgi:Tfp pilus assembly protein PilN